MEILGAGLPDPSLILVMLRETILGIAVQFHVRAYSGLLLAVASGNALSANQLVYIALDQPCRVLDTRTLQGGAGVLTAAHGNYTFGTRQTDIESAAQHGSSTGCGIPDGVSAVSVSINQLDTTAAGNIRAWSSDAGSTGPAAGTAVYNPSVPNPAGGQVLYNGAFSTIAVGADGKFFLSVANGQLDMTINAVGYWESVGSSNQATLSGNAVALGYGNNAFGLASFSLGTNNTADNDYEFVAGSSNQAESAYSILLGKDNYANGVGSVAIGASNSVTDVNSIAIGYDNLNYAANTIVMGYFGFAPSNAVDSFIFNDGSSPQVGPSASHVFWARASNGIAFYSSADLSTGAQLHAGSGSWTAVSDRNVKDSVAPIDSRDVLDRVVAMPLATWHYKAQDPQYRHMGPMAQDFHEAFGLGESDTGIDTIDADGVALAAIQGLNAKLERENADKALQIEAVERENASLKADMADLKAAVKSLQRDSAASVTAKTTP